MDLINSIIVCFILFINMSCYQTLHFFSGFISSSFLQLNAVEKSSEFANVPKTLEQKYYQKLSG